MRTARFYAKVWFLGLGLTAAQPFHAQGQEETPRPGAADTTASTHTPAIRVAGDGVLEVGKVRVNQRARSITFPAELNKADGAMEYLLVTNHGKTHESILRTGVSPFEIHVAMLLLGAKGSGTNSFDAPPPKYGGAPGLEIDGDPVSIELRWTEQNKKHVRAGWDLIMRHETNPAPPPGKWVYNGSTVWRGRFLAEQSGSIISLIADPMALINTPLRGHDENEGWTARKENVPPPGAPVEVTIKLEGPRSR